MGDVDIDRAFVRLDHGLMHYRERPGDTGQPPLLLLHASPNSSLSMEPILRAYPEGRRLIALDTPGNGDSEKLPATRLDMPDYAEALQRFCQALDLEQVVIFGSHTGAHIGLELAVRHPERVACLAVDGLLVLEADERDEYLARYAPPREPDEAGSQFHWAWQYVRDQMIFFPHFKKDLEHLRAGGVFDAEFLHRMTMDVLGSLRTYHLAYEAVFRHPVAEQLAQLTRPICWLDTGEGYLDKGLNLMRETARQASVVELTHTPEAFAEQLEILASDY